MKRLEFFCFNTIQYCKYTISNIGYATVYTFSNTPYTTKRKTEHKGNDNR